MAYWDTSCLLKLYVKGESVVTSNLARFELWAALWRKESLRAVSPGSARAALHTFDTDDTDFDKGLISVITLGPAVASRFKSVIETCATKLPPMPLRTLDAIDLAPALVSGETQIITTDGHLRQAVSAFGLSLYPPQ